MLQPSSPFVASRMDHKFTDADQNEIPQSRGLFRARFVTPFPNASKAAFANTGCPPISFAFLIVPLGATVISTFTTP